MFVQASVYNRSWLKPQLAKALILIVLIVPLLAVNLEGNQEAAAVNADLPSPQKEAAGSSNVALSKRPTKVTQRVANKPSVPSNDLVYTPWRNSTKRSIHSKDLVYAPARVSNKIPASSSSPEKLLERVEKLKMLVYPRKGESSQDSYKRWAQTRNLIQQNVKSSSIDTKDPKLWQQVVMDMIQEGYLKDASYVMQWIPRFFHHDRKDFAFFHAAVARGAKKTKPFEGGSDIPPLTEMAWISDCNEWVLEDFAAKIDESCSHLQILKGSGYWLANEVRALLTAFNECVYSCNNKYDSYKKCEV